MKKHKKEKKDKKDSATDPLTHMSSAQSFRMTGIVTASLCEEKKFKVKKMKKSAHLLLKRCCGQVCLIWPRTEHLCPAYVRCGQAQFQFLLQLQQLLSSCAYEPTLQLKHSLQDAAS